MPNQLSIPFKKTYLIPIREAVRDYILAHYTDTHPDAYRWDINQWERLRADAVSEAIHVDRVNALISYHAQLVFILTKLPPDIGLEIPYAPVFNASALPESFKNLVYDRAGVLFNLASLYCQLGAAEDRSTPLGLRQAIKFYQNAAGTLNHLAGSVLLQLQASLAPESVPLDFTEHFVRSLECLMLAQAQECVWQRAVLDNYKNALIAKLAAKVSSFYGSAVTHAREPSIRHLYPMWLTHMETKDLHFRAAAQYRRSLEDLEAHRYGHEIARLLEAQTLAKKGADIARRGGAVLPVQQDIKSLLEIVQKNISRAERDNNLIYHQDVPPASALPAIQEVSMSQPILDAGLQNPKMVIGNNAVIFGELLGWGARLAIEIYKDRRHNWIMDEISERIRCLDDSAACNLGSLNLPTALDALDRPVGLPPSLVTKAAEVKRDCGPERIETSIRDVKTLADHNAGLLDEAMDILDQEADDDELFREGQVASERLPSHEANKDLIEKAQRFRAVLQQARDSDEVVRQKWEEWEDNVIQLTWDEAELESSIPSSTGFQMHPANGPDATRRHARALRALLENLDDLSKSRVDLVARVNRLAASDDITPRILKAALGMEQWVNVQPAMFEDILDEELSKFDKFRVQVEEGERKQSELLEAVKERHAVFVQSRKEDVTAKEREHALQSLDLAYHKYKEIVRNLEEGLKFYNDFSMILSQFRDMCKGWANMRRQEMSTLTRGLDSLSIAEGTTAGPDTQSPAAPSAQSPQPVEGEEAEDKDTASRRHVAVKQPQGAVFDLPPPDSDEWETMEMPPAPRYPQQKTTRVVRRTGRGT